LSKYLEESSASKNCLQILRRRIAAANSLNYT